MPARDYAATRFSGLTEITAANAKNLRPTWSFSTGVLGGHEGQPLVVGSTMYVVTPYPNVLYAFDLTQGRLPAPLEVPALRRPAGNRHCLLRHREPRSLLRRRQDRVQPARRPHGGGGRRHRPGALEDEGRRSRRRRDDPDGAAGGEGPGDRRQCRRGDGRARMGEGARPRDRRDRLDGYNIGPDAEVLASPATFKPFYQKDQELALDELAQPMDGSMAARRCGDGFPTIPSSTWCTTAPAIPLPGTPSSARATTAGPPACWPATRATDRSGGPTSSRRPTTGTTTRPRR